MAFLNALHANSASIVLLIAYLIISLLYKSITAARYTKSGYTGQEKVDIKTIDEEGINLVQCALDYLIKLGLSEQERLEHKHNTIIGGRALILRPKSKVSDPGNYEPTLSISYNPGIQCGEVSPRMSGQRL